MRAIGLIALVSAAGACAQVGPAPAAPPPVPATAEDALRQRTVELRNTQGAVVGTAHLLGGSHGVLITVDLPGGPDRLATGWHGMHLHAVGECTGPKFTTAGPHMTHDAGHPAPDARHGLDNPVGGPEAGDLPNIYVWPDGRARAEVFTGRLFFHVPSVHGDRPWLQDQDGSALVIHAARDDHRSQPSGGSGDRVACAVISGPRS